MCILEKLSDIFPTYNWFFRKFWIGDNPKNWIYIQISIYLTAPIFLSALFRSRIHIHCLHTGKAFVQLCHVYNYCSISVIKFNLVHFCRSRLQSYHKEIFKCQFPRFSSTHLCGVGQWATRCFWIQTHGFKLDALTSRVIAYWPNLKRAPMEYFVFNYILTESPMSDWNM